MVRDNTRKLYFEIKCLRSGFNQGKYYWPHFFDFSEGMFALLNTIVICKNAFNSQYGPELVEVVLGVLIA